MNMQQESKHRRKDDDNRLQEEDEDLHWPKRVAIVTFRDRFLVNPVE